MHIQKTAGGVTRSSQKESDKHERCKNKAHLVDVFEFVYNLADDRLKGLVAPGVGAGVGPLQAGPRKPDRTGRKH